MKKKDNKQKKLRVGETTIEFTKSRGKPVKSRGISDKTIRRLIKQGLIVP